MPASLQSLLKVELSLETDFLLARQRAKQIAALVGFELQDQTRIATAVSEIARNAWEYGKGGMVEYFLDPAGGRASAGLRIVVTDRGPGIANLEQIWAGTYVSETGMGIGMLGARRLLDDVEVQTGAGGTQVTLLKQLPRQAPDPPPVPRLAAELARTASASSDTTAASVALHDQNQELLTLLSELRARESELRALNVELEETNRGVLALYAELADKAHAVQQASEMKTRFLSGVTHELRTPLNSIVSLSRLLIGQTDGPLNSEQHKQANFILRSAQNLTEMVNDLLDLAKIEAGKSAVSSTRFTVQDLFAALRGMFRPLATDPEVKLIFEIPDQKLELLSDEGKLSQILRNFISNALKFTDRGSVTIKAEPLPGAGQNAAEHQDLIRFSVIDTGVGIAAEHHELVMQEWGQVTGNAPHKKRAKGSGLGLPLSRSLAELLQGTVSFESKLGQGSAFHVTLPALVEPAAEVAPAKSPGLSEDYILIIDDDEVSRYLLRRQLESMTSAPVEEVTGGEAGLRAIAERLPKLVFIDLLMPEVAGELVARQLRAEERTRSLPIVLHTSKTLSAEEARTLGALDLTIIQKRPARDTRPRQRTRSGLSLSARCLKSVC